MHEARDQKMNTDSRPLFTSRSIGNLSIKNRFVRSATYESVAGSNGCVDKKYGQIYETLARGEIGLIITGMIYTTPAGKSYPRQAGLHSDRTISGFAQTTSRVHENGSRVFAQLCHGGRQSLVLGVRPPAPSAVAPDLFYRVVPRAMKQTEIIEAIESFSHAARRAKTAGFDGVQIHAAHGYLLSTFLSPFFNRRTDEWGGSSLKRFALLKRVIEAVRDAVDSTYPVTVKINIEDHTPKPGLSLDEAAEHVERLVELGVDAIEISCGTLSFSTFNQSRGGIPVPALAKTMPRPLQPLSRLVLRLAYPPERYAFYEGYNLPACARVKPLMGSTPLILVGGLRDYQSMENIIRDKEADFVSMSRPFVREPTIVRKWKQGEMSQISCSNCNNCFGAIALEERLTCNRDRIF